MTKQLERLVFLGASAVPEVMETIHDINAVEPTFEVVAALDDNERLHGSDVQGIPVLGGLDRAHDFHDEKFVMSIGSYRTRLIRPDVIRRLDLPRERYATIVHPYTQVARSAEIGHGCIFHMGVVIGCDSVVEDFVVLQPQCLIGASSYVCEGALFAAAVYTTAWVTIGHYCHVGLGTRVGEYVKIGPGAQVAMASVILRDVPAGVFWIQDRVLDRKPVPEEILARWKQLVPARPKRGTS